MEDSTREHLARAVAQCRRKLATWSRPSDLAKVQARLGEIERAIHEGRAPTPVDPEAWPALAEPLEPSGRLGHGLRIAVPLRQFGPAIGGTAVYTRNVLTGLARDYEAKLTIFTVEGQIEPLRDAIPGADLRAVPDGAAGLSIERDLDPGAFDVLFCPLAALDPPRPALPAAVTIHDLGHEAHPENFDRRTLELRRRTQRAAANADLILTVSEFSKRAIATRYGIDPERITVAPPGVSPVFTEPPPLEPSPDFRALELADDFLYYPANYWPVKNHRNLLEALRIVHDRFPDLELVLTGAPGPDADRVAAIAGELGVAARVRMLGLVEHALVRELARHSAAVTYVSQYEGFGIPIVEAMHSGAPVITSTAEACREVGGDAVLRAPYDEPRAIAAEIERLLDRPQLARELAARGRRRAQEFSWGRSVAVIATALGRIAHRRGAELKAPGLG